MILRPAAIFRRVAREPLFHFLLLGGFLFTAYEWLGGARARAPQSIVVTQTQIEALATGFARTWQRPPSQTELNGLVADYVRQAVYAREARALGMDRDDIVINRRLRQKLEFVTDDVAAQARPTEAQLRAYLQAHADTFLTEPRTTMDQVFLSRDRHRSTMARDVSDLTVRLNREGPRADPSKYGDATLLQSHFELAPDSEIAAAFGPGFTAKLAGFPAGVWQGPVESEYGAHLVRVTERRPREVPAFEDVKAALSRQWATTQRDQANDAFYHELLKGYTVTIEAPRVTSDEPRRDMDLASQQSR